MSPAWCFLCFVVVLLQCSRNVSAQEEQQDDGCYSPGSIAGIVIATVVVTLVTAALAAAFIWYLWKQRKNGYGEDKAHEKGPPMSPDKQLIVKENSDYAFDNPYFKDDETDHTKHDAAEKGESGFRLDNGDINPSQNNTKANGQAKKNRPFSSLPFHAVFHPSGKKQQQKATMDDTYISKAAERVEVPLRGHDFTGLGFDICGNMRDGIFVKDVLHRGPASESGKIKAGDRIVGVRVSFGAMVYEDALTILSYASPYDVRLELEKAPEPAKRAASIRSQCAGARRLFHPLYRSRSIDDLTQIGKDAYLGTDSPAVPSKSPKEATPKRSQSVEASNGGLKSRVAAFTLIKPRDDSKSRKSSTSSCDSASTKPSTTPLPETAAEVKEEPVCVKKEVKSSRFRVEQINVKSEAPVKVAPPAKPARDLSEDKLPVKEEEKTQVVDPLPQEQPQPTAEAPPPPEDPVPEERPTAPPRKTGTPAKRRAPAPPPTSETAAQVHRAQEQTQQPEAAATEDPEDPPPPPTSAVPEREDAVSMSGSVGVGEEPSSPGKRKAASLGDLTRLDAKAAAASSAVLERAVSLDLQQSLPGENLVKQQKRILRAPAFEDDYVESKESDLDVQIIQENGLKRWENGLDTVLPTLENGIGKHDETDEIDDDLTLTDTTPESIATTTTTDIKTEVTTINNTEATGEIQQLRQNAKEDEDEVTVIPRTPPAPQKKILTIDLDLNLDSTSSSSSSSNTSSPQLTSTPARKLEPSSEESSAATRVGPPLFSPVSVSIPVIKPDLTHFEKLPSPPGGADPGRRAQLQSLYRPLFGGGEDQQQAPPLANGGSPPNSVAGFAKTLIVPGPNEVDSLLGLASEPNEPPSPMAETSSVDVE